MKSALLVDFDNIVGAVGLKLFESSISQWILWMEDGALSGDGRRRKFLSKRVYWNGQYDVHRPVFEAAGFEAFTCKAFAKNKVTAGKSSADTFITMDALDLARDLKGLEELIILTTDSDFVPVVNRVQGRDLRVVTAGKETDPTYNLYSQHADDVMHIGALKAACEYERAKRKWYRLRSAPPVVAPLVQAAERASPLMGRVRADLNKQTGAEQTGKPKADRRLADAAKLIVKLGERTPDQAIAKKKILRALKTVEGFSTTKTRENKAWLGQKSYVRLMTRLAENTTGLAVQKQGAEGVHVIYREPAAPVEVPDERPQRRENPFAETAPAEGSLLDKGPRGGLQAEG